ncbi:MULTISPECIES: GNAT family N-acetyltransferase [unclassified Cupriavidus]|uniref:GNAT family N-acetyltransferase n=2 Tax=unclassified Cupriavidus TaxID=2640874 RepID=UPI001C00364D|nr:MULTISPECIES: GNAT family N-acetyltransferase [unclassified Cupriavidus]MCA3185728.1 GNAT family N-acetyltransferase [Cupriavidus sp.]MCA3191133.1 GNAT family N-acetyltransferase [Cupriavidus sp.]MCA3195191.1 GNAT family N-acetyltransferase [Cupriavidus sp.]MCA3204161.1 GNAT family N-acetyltransferase [Cupriavidus sp.]MCA3210115.1 GNAT family N-acetyltransferase [Cupriavidus sp.]
MAMTVFSIRPATPADSDTLFRLISALAEYEKLTHLVEATPQKLGDALFGARPHAEAVIVEVDHDGAKRAVGFALFFHNFSTFLAKPGLYLEDLFVEPAWRGHGLGKTLLKHLAALAVERGCGRFEWSVLDWNQPSIDFYQAMGADVMPDWRICRVTGEALRALSAA